MSDERPIIISCAEATARGLKRYFTGQPCSRGHIAERIVSSRQCRECARIVTAIKLARWSAENPDRVRENKQRWAEQNQDKRRASEAAYYAKNKDKVKAAAKAWQKANPEKVSAYAAAYLQENLVAHRVQQARRRAIKRRVGGNHTAADIDALFSIQRGKCAFCRQSIRAGYHIDHILPLALSGGNDKRNLQLLCAPCNLSKGAKHPVDFAQSRGVLL